MSETTQATTPSGDGPATNPLAAELPRVVPSPQGPAAPGPAPQRGANFPGPAAFRAGTGPEDKLIGQVAFALAAESGQPPRDAEAMKALRDQATAALSDFAFRYLHNRAEEIRRDAAAEAAAKAPRPPGFVAMVIANLVALTLASAAGAWVAMNTHLLAGLAGH